MSYFESRLPVSFDDFNELLSILGFCEKLGIRRAILEPKNNLITISLDLKSRIKENTKLDIFYRINLKFDYLDDFKKKIKHYNNFSDILSVESMNKEVQLHAARDSRVDIVSYSNPEIIRTLIFCLGNR